MLHKARRLLTRRTAGITAAVLTVLGTAAAPALPAGASSGVNISGSVSQQNAGIDACGNFEGYNGQAILYYCLFYSPNFTGGVWAGDAKNVNPIADNFWICNDTGCQHTGPPVRNDAASMVNFTGNCNVTTWVSPNFMGDWNWLPSFWAGNLTSSGSVILRNNEAVIGYNNCTGGSPQPPPEGGD